MKKSEPITVKGLVDFAASQEVTYASSARENKKLVLVFPGGYKVYHNFKCVYEGIQPHPAVEAYNAITEKAENPHKNFVL